MRRLGIVACITLPGQTAAQLPPVGVPGGVVRVELDGTLETFDQRYLNGTRQNYAADLASPAFGSDRIPLLVDTDARIARIISNPGYRINLGVSSADAHADVSAGSVGLSLGVTSNVTVFGRMPLVRARVQSTFQVNPSTADAGLNPGPEFQLPFFGEMDAALATLSSKLAAGDYDANPTQKALAQATLADATSLRTDLFGLLADPATFSPALPTGASVAGTALDARITGLQTTLATDLNVPGFTQLPALPDAAVTEADVIGLLTSPTERISTQLSQTTVSFRGDAEVGATITPIDGWDRGAHRGGFRAAISGLVRLPTGRRDQTDRPLDLGTGDQQTDFQIDVVTDLGSGPIGARLAGSYVRQLASNILLRVAPPSQPFVGRDRLREIRRDPGDILALSVHPFYRLARTFALDVGLDHWAKGTDSYSYADPAQAVPGIDANVLAEDSKANATVLSVGVTYANPGGLRPGGTGLPVDATWSYQRVIRAGGGRVPDSHAVRATLKLYFGIW